MATGVFGRVGTYNADTGGLYRVAGTTALFGPPEVAVSCLVLLIHRKTNLVARSVYSDANGNYSFDFVSYGPWVIATYYPTDEYNAEISDRIYGTLL